MRKTALFVLACLLACGGAQPPPPPPKHVELPGLKPGEQASDKPAFDGAPSTPAGDQLAWVLDVIVHRKGKLERAELEQHFHPSFLQQVPSDQMLKILVQLGDQLSELSLTGVEGNDDRLVAHALASGVKLRLSLVLDAPSKQISGLLIKPDVDDGLRPQSFEDALHTTVALAPKAQMLVASLDAKGQCHAVQELAARDELAIGSSFKLYVLLALADQLIAGKVKWTDELAVHDDWKSLPSGVTQNELPTTKHPLQLYAERMISISDNTAADHLLYTLGRRQVEAALRTAHHAQPALDTPFLSTRELFVLKLGAKPDELEHYLKLPEAGRRGYLDKTLASKAPPVAGIADWKTARQVDKLEWYASANDLCNVMGALWTRAQNPKAAAVLDVLAKNPGLPVDRSLWSYVGFKGGSEPGVVNITYLLKRVDGQWFVIVFSFNAAEGGTLEDSRIFNLVGGVLDLVGQQAQAPAPAPASPPPAAPPNPLPPLQKSSPAAPPAH